MVWSYYPAINDEIENFEAYLDKTLKSKQVLIKETISDLANSGGKRIRPTLVMATAHLGQYNRKKVWSVAAAIEILHMATLVHDDIIDDSNLRRGNQTIQSKYGKDIAVVTGDYLFSLTYNILSNDADIEQLREVSKVIKRICEGEVKEYQERYNMAITYKDYFERIRSKTSLLFESSCILGADLGGLDSVAKRKLAHYGRYLGMAFQLTDDILDITQKVDQLGKPVINDFTQGIYTLPLLYVIYETDNSKRLKELLEEPVDNSKRIKELVSNSGALEYTFEVAHKYIDKAKDELNFLSNKLYQDILLGMADRILNREF